MENCFYIGLIFALIAVYVKGDFPTGATQALSCIFKNTFKSPCHSDNELKIPSNLFKLFNELPESTQERLQNGELESLTDMQFASLPVVFLALLPENRLSHLDASKLVRVIATHPGDLSLAYHMVSGVKTAQQKVDFMEKVSRLNTSTEVKHVLASTTSHILNTLQQREPHVRDIIHMPFLVHMPPRYLLQLNNSEAQRIVSSLPKEIEYEELTPLETRIWALLSIDQQTKFDWQLTGFTEEDLTRISVTPDKFKTDFNIIQARAVFEKVYENKIYNRINFVESILLLPKQTPSTLQKFPMNVHDYLDFTILPPSSSLATSKQIMEYIIANCLETKKLGDDKYKWGQRIKYVKKWVYALPPSVLKQYRTQTVLSHEILYETQSKMLTDRQAYYLTAQGQSLNLSLSDSILKFTDNLLSALPTTQLQEHSMGSYSSRVLEHLLGHLPDKNVPRMVSLLVKTIDSFDSDEVFYNLLKNKAAHTAQAYLMDLSVLLRAAKLDDMWTWGNFINSSQPLYMVINGLNCDHVNNMAITDFTTVIAYYNQQREVLKKVFPKNLQYCCLRKLMEYLKMKVELQGVYQDRETVLGPMEIEAVGGYVLLGLPTEVIEENKYKKLIFAAIGKLSIPELLTATDLTKLKEIAKLAVKYLFDQHFADYFELGNLVWFVHPKTLPESSTSTFKLAIEGQMLDKRLCLGTEERDAWSTILIQCFGLPESWSKGKLSTLGDLLLVFPEDVLLRVNETSWVDAADTLQSNYYDTVEWTQPMPFYKVCLMVLDEKEGEAYLSAVKGLVRWRLRAAERQLNSVYKASNVQLKTKKLHSLEINSNGLIKQSNMKVKPYNPFEDENTEITEIAEINDSTEYGEELSTETEETSTTEDGEKSTTETKEESTTEIKEESTTEIKEELTTEIKEESTTETKEESTTEIKEESTTEIKEELTTEIKEESTTEIKEESSTEIKEELTTEIKEESTAEIKDEPTNEIKEEPTTEIKEESTTETTKRESTTETTKKESTTEFKEEPTTETTKEESTTETTKKEPTTETKQKLPIVTKVESSAEIKEESTSEIKEESTTEFKEEPTTEPTKEESTTETTKKEPTTETKQKLPIVTKVESSAEIKEESITETTKRESTTETTKKESTTETKEKFPFVTKEESSTEIKEESTTEAREESTTEQKVTTKIKVELTTEINGKSTKIEAFNNQTTKTIDDVTSSLELSTEKLTPSKTTLGQTSDATINTKTTEQNKLSNNESHISNKSSTEKNNFDSDSLVTEKNRTTIIEVKPTPVDNNVTFNHTTENKSPVPNNNRTTVLPQNITKSKNTSAIYNIEDLSNATVTDSQSQITNTTPKQNSTWFSDKPKFYSFTTESTSPNSTSSSVEVSLTDYSNVNLITDNQIVEEIQESVFNDDMGRIKRSIFIDWSTIKFSCDALKMVGEIAALSLTSEDIDNMKHAELNDCGDVLGQFDLQDDVYNNIWGRLDEKDPIHLMGNLLKAFTVTDLMSNKMKLSEPWTLETISALSQQTTEIFLIDSLLDELKWQNSNLKKINVETIAALNGLICHLDIENIQSIWLNFHHVVVLQGRLPGCPVCLAKLAEIAISQNGFGNIEQWKVEDVETLGSIVAGLNNSLWNDFLQSPNNLLLGLQPAAINCISTVQLQTIPKEMFSSIPPLTLAMITKEKLIDLTDEQRSAIQDVKNLKINADFLSKKNIVIAGYPGSSSTMHGLSLTLILLIISLYTFL